VVVLLIVALLLLFWNLSSALITVPPRSTKSNIPTVTENTPAANGTQANGTTPAGSAQAKPSTGAVATGNSGSAASSPTVPTATGGASGLNATPTPSPAPYSSTIPAQVEPQVATPAPAPAPAPQPQASSPAPAATAPPGPAPYFSPPPALSASFYGAGSSLIFNPKKEPGRISIMFTTSPKVPLAISGFQLDFSGTLQIGNALLEVWPVPQKVIIGQSSGGTGRFSWTAQKPFIVGDGAVSYTITFTAMAQGKLDIQRARVLYLENGQPRSLEVSLSGAVIWGQESFDDPLRAVTGDLFSSRFVVMSRIASGFYVLNKIDSTEPYVLYFTPAQGTLNVGDRIAARGIWTGQRIGGVPELDASGSDGYVKLLTLP